MAAFFIPTSLFALCFIFFYPQLLPAAPISSFSFQRFDKLSNFNSLIAFYGDANAVSNGSALQLTNSVSSSAGRVMYKNPIKFAEGKPVKLASFSSYLSFSMSPEVGDGLAFVMVSGGFNVSDFDYSNPFGLSLRSEKSDSEFVAVEFDTKRDVKYDDLNGNHVGINVGGFDFESVKAISASSVHVLLNNGKRLNSWIDYEASSKRLEVRLSQFGDLKPIDPLLSYQIDLSKLWKDEKVYLGLSSSNGNSSQTCLIHSWSFQLRGVPPHWMHSQPLDPETVGKNAKAVVVLHKRSACVLRVLAAMVFGTACGALGAFMVLYLWTIFGSRRPVVPEECSSVHPVDFEYKKVKVVSEKVEDGKQ